MVGLLLGQGEHDDHEGECDGDGHNAEHLVDELVDQHAVVGANELGVAEGEGVGGGGVGQAVFGEQGPTGEVDLQLGIGEVYVVGHIGDDVDVVGPLDADADHCEGDYHIKHSPPLVAQHVVYGSALEGGCQHTAVDSRWQVNLVLQVLAPVDDLALQLEEVLHVAGAVEWVAVLADADSIHHPHVGVVGAGEDALPIVGEVGADNAAGSLHLSIGAVGTGDGAHVRADHLIVVDTIKDLAGEAVGGIKHALDAAAVAGLALVAEVLAEVAQVAGQGTALVLVVEVVGDGVGVDVGLILAGLAVVKSLPVALEAAGLALHAVVIVGSESVAVVVVDGTLCSAQEQGLVQEEPELALAAVGGLLRAQQARPVAGHAQIADEGADELAVGALLEGTSGGEAVLVGGEGAGGVGDVAADGALGVVGARAGEAVVVAGVAAMVEVDGVIVPGAGGAEGGTLVGVQVDGVDGVDVGAGGAVGGVELAGGAVDGAQLALVGGQVGELAVRALLYAEGGSE